jgi:hypothetical protein
MDILNFVIAVFILGAPVGLGAYMVAFSRRFSLSIFRTRKALWKIDFTEFDLKVGRVFTVIGGAVLAIGGFIVAVQLVLR